MVVRILFAALLFALAASAQSADQRRREALDLLLDLLPAVNQNITGRINAHDTTWRGWQARTGELPPDFEAMPSIAELPDPLLTEIGGEAHAITTVAAWKRKRESIREQFERWVYGSVPPPPDNLRALVEKEEQDGDVTIRTVRLEFGPGRKAHLKLEVILPPGEGPFPVFLSNHARTRPWLNTAVRRGYIACVYFATDPNYGYPDDSESYIEAYPDHDFSTIARWGWSASRAVDYLTTLPQVDAARIGLTGHSRNGKQALFGAAFDERIAAVIPSSGNTGEGDPWRYTTDPFRNETIEQITTNFPHWFHPRLRFFVGREHKLPVDQNSLMALVAPRGLMLATAYSETQGNTLGFEQAYKSVREVYRFLGAEDKLALSIRPGIHSTTAGDIEAYVDFFDAVFERGDFALREDWVHDYDWDRWRDFSGVDIDVRNYPLPESLADEIGPDLEAWREQREEIRERVGWALGEEPSGVTFPARTSLDGLGMSSDGWLGDLHGRPLKLTGGGATDLAFGDDLRGDLYYPGADGAPAKANLPVVIWLHPYAYPTGYSRYARRPFESLLLRGFAVFAFDQIGFGTRVLDGGSFYERHPAWSLLGKMVADTRAAVGAMAALGEGGVIDPERIYLAGYSLGGKVALWTAALDERIAGVAAANAFAPLRLAAAAKGVEGLRHYSHLHGLVPRFGFFVGEERRLPIDYAELLALVAPRPVYVSAATHDRYHPLEDVRETVESARKAYELFGEPGALELATPRDFNRFQPERADEVFDWLEERAKR